MPQSAPMAQAFSYSGPSPAIFQLRGCVLTMNLLDASPGSLVTRPQAMVQAKHALLATRRVLGERLAAHLLGLLEDRLLMIARRHARRAR